MEFNDYKDHDDKMENAPVVVIARFKTQNLERGTIWRADARNLPAGTELKLILRQPFPNFKSAREAIAQLLNRPPEKVKFMSFKGSKTFYPKDGIELSQITQPVGTKPTGQKISTYGGDYTV